MPENERIASPESRYRTDGQQFCHLRPSEGTSLVARTMALAPAASRCEKASGSPSKSLEPRYKALIRSTFSTKSCIASTKSIQLIFLCPYCTKALVDDETSCMTQRLRNQGLFNSLAKAMSDDIICSSMVGASTIWSSNLRLIIVAIKSNGSFGPWLLGHSASPSQMHTLLALR